MPHAPLLLGLSALWILSELWYGRRRAADRGKAHDRGTLRLLHVAIWLSIALAVWLSMQHAGQVSASWQAPWYWAGCALMALGLVFRWWAIRVLDRYFTVDVAIRPDHELVRRGPYRVLRHPSYTGALLTFYGFGLALGNALALAAVVVVVTAAFAWRIRVEERALVGAFPDDYPRYARQTWRVFPFVW